MQRGGAFYAFCMECINTCKCWRVPHSCSKQEMRPDVYFLVVVVVGFPAFLFVQTYGSKNVKRVGTILQRGILILLLFCFPCWAIFINTEQILLLFRQDPEVSRSDIVWFF